MRAPSQRLILLPLAWVALAAQAQTTVEAFAPTGPVKAVRQVTARFSAPMVAFGDARLADPFAIDCAEQGSGRWIDARIWSYDFARDVPPGVRCSFTLKPDLRDLAAQPLAGTMRFAFDTGGPGVRESSPRRGSAVDEQQVFILALDSPARPASIAAKAWCGVEGINERIGVRVLAGAERDQVLAARKSYVDRYIKDYVQHGGTAPKGKDDLPLALVQCKRSLPANAAVSLVWAAGIEGLGGVASSADQALAFTTRRDFTARFSCDYLTANGPCIPLTPLRLTFSEPIARTDADKITLASADGKQYRPTWDSGTAPSAAVSNLHFRGPFAEKSSLQLTLPPGIRDDAGRALVNQGEFPMTIAIDTLPPLLKFPARFGIIEAHTERLLPVTVRNIEAKLTGKVRSAGAMLRVDVQGERQDLDVMAWMKRLAGDSWHVGELSGDELKKSVFAGLKSGKPEPFSLPAPGGGRAFEVIGIPLPKPGFYVVELESPKLGVALFDAKNTNAYVSAAALVTNMAAHFKHGADSSLVWVTSLDKGRPVPKAAVAVRDCSGKLLWQGVADASGVARIDKPLARGVCKGNNSMFISARSGPDYTFTLSSWQNGIESWRFNLPFNPAQSTTIVSTVFARTLLRAGETVHMKHFLRRHGSRGIEFDSGSAEARATTVTIAHQGGDGSYELPLRWNAAGSADNEWVIPAGAKLGVYEVKIAGQLAGTFRVEQFRVPTMKALLNGPATPLIGATAFDLDLQVGDLAGGVAGKAPVKLRTLTEEKVISFEGYDDYNLGAGDVREGVQDEAGYDEDAADDGGEGAAKGADIRTRALVLDKAGGARVKIDHLPVGERARDLVAEVSYQDANGETLSTSTRIALWPSSYVVGIKPDDWADSKDSVSFEVVVLGVDGKPVPDATVDVDLFKRVNYSHRRRLIGGFYAYENSSEITRIGPACQGRTNTKGLLRCTVKAQADGNLVLRARAVDGQQRAAVSQRDVWVAGGGEWWYRAGDNDRIDLLPSAKRYEPGQDATFQVRSPFRDATVLITVEREGILDTYVRRLDGKEPAFTIPMLGKYAPNVFVSAMVVRGRVAGVQPTAMVDLGKPSYKLGIAPVRVGWSAHELKVKVSTDKQDYKVRENATVTLKVTRADGSPAPAGSEVALAAVDTGLLELMPNNSWRLLNAMMQERVLQVETSTAQMQVVGKRHFGRKAVPTGGGGGKGSRELFDTLLFWKPRIVLDAKGEARVPVVLNDTLTSFRIVAIASGGSGLFGTGSTEIRSSQDLIVVPGLPSVVARGRPPARRLHLAQYHRGCVEGRFWRQHGRRRRRSQSARAPEPDLGPRPGAGSRLGCPGAGRRQRARMDHRRPWRRQRRPAAREPESAAGGTCAHHPVHPGAPGPAAILESAVAAGRLARPGRRARDLRGAPGRQPARRARLHDRLPVPWRRAGCLARRGPARPGTVEYPRGFLAVAARCRWPGQVLSNPDPGQRQPDRLPAVGQRRSRPGARAGAQGAHGRGLAPVRPGKSGAQRAHGPRRYGGAQAGGAGGALAHAPGGARAARIVHHRTESVAHVGRYRLVPDPATQSGAGAARRETGAVAASAARAPEPARGEPVVFDREE